MIILNLVKNLFEIINISVGFTLKYLNRHLVFIFLTLIQTIAFALIPLVSDLWTVYLLAFLMNLGVAAFECGAYVWIISMWNSKSSPIMHLTMALFSLGMMLGPLLDTPFILGDVTKGDPQMAALNTTLRDQINYSINRREQLMIPFLIGSAICSLSDFKN